MRHSKPKVNDTGVIIRFSHLLRDMKLLIVFSPKKVVKIQTPYVTTFGLCRTENKLAFSSTKIDTNTKIAAANRLAMRKIGGSILYFPPHAAFPKGNPRG